MAKKIVVIGSLNYDIILKIPRLPECGETLPADQAGFSAGGKGANQAVQAAKLGVETYMVGRVGKDAHGDALIESAQKYQVNTDYITRSEEVTGMGVVEALEDGSVFSCIVRGANFDVAKADIDRAEPVIREADLMILQMEIPQEINAYAIEKAEECGCRVLLNTAPSAPIEEEYLKKCAIIVANEVEAGFYLGENVDSVEKAIKGIKKLQNIYRNDIVITLGKEGSVVSDHGVVTFIPSRKVHAIETTGAGDSFIGGMGYALLKGESLTEACKFATGCSAITVSRMGAQDSMPTLQEVQNQ